MALYQRCQGLFRRALGEGFFASDLHSTIGGGLSCWAAQRGQGSADHQGQEEGIARVPPGRVCGAPGGGASGRSLLIRSKGAHGPDGKAVQPPRWQSGLFHTEHGTFLSCDLPQIKGRHAFKRRRPPRLQEGADLCGPFVLWSLFISSAGFLCSVHLAHSLRTRGKPAALPSCSPFVCDWFWCR